MCRQRRARGNLTGGFIALQLTLQFVGMVREIRFRADVIRVVYTRCFISFQQRINDSACLAHLHHDVYEVRPSASGRG